MCYVLTIFKLNLLFCVYLQRSYITTTVVMYHVLVKYCSLNYNL